MNCEKKGNIFSIINNRTIIVMHTAYCILLFTDFYIFFIFLFKTDVSMQFPSIFYRRN
jgi:hypothetical protein